VWPAYVINLRDNTARMQNSAAQFDAHKIAFSRIDAINGWQMTDADIALVYDAAANQKRGKFPLVRPEIGCYLSHIKAWKAIAQSKADGGFVFEDDFKAGESLGQVLLALSDDKNDWDMVKLFGFDQSPRHLSDRPLGSDHRIVIPYRVPTCLIGYGLSRAAATRLTSRAIPFFRPVDEDQKYFWETGLRVALVLPSPIHVGDQQTSTGTIGNERREAGKLSGLAKMKQRLHGLIYQLRYLAKLHFHRLRGNRHG
jgi:glycosyl transferase, family 25